MPLQPLGIPAHVGSRALHEGYVIYPPMPHREFVILKKMLLAARGGGCLHIRTALVASPPPFSQQRSPFSQQHLRGDDPLTSRERGHYSGAPVRRENKPTRAGTSQLEQERRRNMCSYSDYTAFQPRLTSDYTGRWIGYCLTSFMDIS